MVPLFLWFYFEKPGIVLTVFLAVSIHSEIIMLALMTSS